MSSVTKQTQPYSILMRFSDKVKNGNFQLWNMRFFNFYNGGFEVLLHSKPWRTDLAMPTSVAFLVEGLNVNEYPELLFFDNRQTQHRCFRKATQRSTRTMESKDGLETEIDPTTTKVTIRNGQVVAIDGDNNLNQATKNKRKRTWRKKRRNKSK